MQISPRDMISQAVWDAGLQRHINTIMVWAGAHFMCPIHFLEKEPQALLGSEEVVSRLTSALKARKLIGRRVFVHVKGCSIWEEVILDDDIGEDANEATN